MSVMKVIPTSSNSLIIELYQWKGTEKGHVCVGSFEVSAVDDCLDISTPQNWRTHHRNDVELFYYENEPKFHLQKIGVFDSFKIKEIKKEKEET